MHPFLALFVPDGLILLVAVIAAHIDLFHAWLELGSRYFLYGALGLALLVGWRFNRSRLFYGILILLLAERFATAGAAVGGEAGQAAVWLTATLLPFNFLLLSLIAERGIFTPLGVCRLLFLAVQAAVALVLAHEETGVVLGYFANAKLPTPLGTAISLPVAVCFGGAAATILLRFYRNRDALEQGMLWAMVAGGAALIAAGPPWATRYYFAVAGLILLVATLEAAHGMAFRDELTGLPGRRALNEAMLRLRGQYAVAMLDVDHFKKFNDRHGHEAGDQVLRMVAGKFQRVGGGGRAFRYGGEEFTILFPGKSRQEAMPYLEEVRRSVAEAGFRIRNAKRPIRKPRNGRGASGSRQKVSVTVSIGVAERQNGKDHAALTMQKADKALYRAKNAGRNQVAA